MLNEKRVCGLHMCAYIYIFHPFITLSKTRYSFHALIFHLLPAASPSIHLHMENTPPTHTHTLAVAWALVPISTLDSRGVAFTLAINPFQPVSASLPIGYSLTWPPVGVRNIWFGVTTAVSSRLAVRCVPPPKVPCVEMSVPSSSPTFFSLWMSVLFLKPPWHGF